MRKSEKLPFFVSEIYRPPGNYYRPHRFRDIRRFRGKEGIPNRCEGKEPSFTEAGWSETEAGFCDGVVKGRFHKCNESKDSVENDAS